MPDYPVMPGMPLSLVLFLSALLMQPLQFLVPTFLLAGRSPRRDGYGRRVAAALAAVAAFNLAVSLFVWRGMSAAEPSGMRYVVNFTVYSLYLVLLVPAVRWCFDMGIWDALFCATAGYTIQNLGSGTGEFLRLATHALTGAEMGQLAATILSDCSVFAIVFVYYLVFIRHLGSLGQLGRDSRGMLAVLVGVILVVIAFDVVVRGLGREGAGLGFLLVLRVIHAAVSLFVLFAEYEMLYNVKLNAEVAARERLSAERERQYELSRETIAAVNRRVHDIRRKVLGDLAASEAPINREVLAEVARDIEVYDAPVRTGNDVIDTILTEKSLVCRRRGVTLSCIADGTALAQLPTTDLYALFGVLLDGAIDAVCGLDDMRRRSVTLTLRRVGDLALVHLEHYAGDSGAANDATLREIVERHGGTLAAARRGDAAVVDVMLPVR